MRVTFLIIKDYRQYHSLSSGPIGLAYLASAAKARFPDIDIRIEVDPQRIIDDPPDIIGVSAYTETYSQSIDAAIQIRKRLGNIPIWLGGPHINALPQTLAPCFDIGVIGEGENTFVELLERFQAGQLHPPHLVDVKGIVYWEGLARKQTPPRDTVADMDLIIPPDRSVLKTWWPPSQSMIQWPQPIYTSRGCPFKCIFCIFSMEQQKVRYHSVERVISEIEEILRQNPGQESISIHDDLFALSKKRLHALTEGIRAAGLHKRVSFVGMAKASIFDDEMAMLMRDMNMSILTFGLESGVQRILHYLKGPRAKVSENARAIELCAKHGIRMGGYFIIGTPNETYQELQQAYWFIRDHYPPMTMAGVFRLTPFPGTKFWEEAVERGLVRSDMEDWTPFNYADLEKKDYLFHNDHYSLAEFKFAYDEFCKIMDKNNIGLRLDDYEKQLTRQHLPAYNEALQALPAGATVLEISGFTRLEAWRLARDQGLDLDVTRICPWEWEPDTLTEGYDLVICTYGLEQSPHRMETLLASLHRALKPGGRLLLLMQNPRHLNVLMRLVSGQWDNDLKGFRPFDILRLSTLPQVQAQLMQLGLSLASVAPLQDDGASVQPHLVEQSLALIRQYVPQADLSTLHTFAYTLITTPKLPVPVSAPREAVSQA
jgi:anaerobic magnesium-protoporphyrin IX monomethyl ester cyclase